MIPTKWHHWCAELLKMDMVSCINSAMVCAGNVPWISNWMWSYRLGHHSECGSMSREEMRLLMWNNNIL